MTVEMAYPMHGLNSGERIVDGRILTQGTSDPTKKGLGFTVARTGVGDYTVTLSEKMTAFRNLQVTPVLDAEDTTDSFVQVHSMDVSSGVGTFKLTIKSSADVSTTDYAPADLAAGNEVHFRVAYLRDEIPGSN